MATYPASGLGASQQAGQWALHRPPRPPVPVQQNLKGFIAAHEDIICLLFEHSSTAQPPGKVGPLPCLQPIHPFKSNLHILCVLSAYVSAMVCVWNAHGGILGMYKTHIIQVLFDYWMDNK